MFQKNSGVRAHAGGSVSKAGAARHAARAADEELHHREHQHVVRPRELRHVHDVHREQQRRHQRLGVSSIGEYSGRKKLESRDVSQEAAAKGAQKPMLPASEKPAEFLFRTPWFRALLYIT